MTTDEIMVLVDQYARLMVLHEQYGEPYDNASNKHSALRAAVERVMAERDALKELLREARGCVKFRSDERWLEEDERLLARIDAALNALAPA